MLRDFAEANVLGEKSVCCSNAVEITAASLESIVVSKVPEGTAAQIDAASGANNFRNLLVSTDPPYYDNISCAGLSDFFYVWLRRTVGALYPDIFSTVLVPKTPELTASPERFHGDKQQAKEHFERGFHYAFKQDDADSGAADDGEAGSPIDLTTGWETLLDALISSGFQITAT